MRNRRPAYHFPPCGDDAGVVYVPNQSEVLDLIGFCPSRFPDTAAGAGGHDRERDVDDEPLLAATG